MLVYIFNKQKNTSSSEQPTTNTRPETLFNLNVNDNQIQKKKYIRESKNIYTWTEPTN